MKSPVSHVWLRPNNQRQSVLTAEEFLDQHPGQRAEWILADICTFLTPSGSPVPLEQALWHLQECWVLSVAEKQRAA